MVRARERMYAVKEIRKIRKFERVDSVAKQLRSLIPNPADPGSKSPFPLDPPKIFFFELLTLYGRVKSSFNTFNIILARNFKFNRVSSKLKISKLIRNSYPRERERISRNIKLRLSLYQKYGISSSLSFPSHLSFIIFNRIFKFFWNLKFSYSSN